MKNNNKGFTLIELIATIGIMILIGFVIVNNMSSLFSKQSDENYENFKKELEDSACIYVETKWSAEKRNNCKISNNCSVEVEELIEEGLIEDTKKDPNTEELVTNNKEKYKVNVRWVDNVKTCTMGDEK